MDAKIAKRRWQITKRSGGYRRKVQKVYESINKLTNVSKHLNESASLPSLR